ncbi:MAG: hypothetical protein J6J36_02910 [Clostridia bacterium]|nr:hypothetical protein [Clostridia bacterium]
MNITQFILEVYIGNALSSRQQMVLPVIIAIQQAVGLCQQVYGEAQPMKLVFINEYGEMIEYKNPAFLKFERG